ncbi:hypothetical protein Sliba_78790 [Streptomyces nigrescens]|uniref:Uncharacterized protein n=1 Tax=Streptomyces nigrescens TaxID=1920 RepID=A0A640TZR8_STRNI|nr:hypothetical protein Sliba_78790 [Streptomyces libani subsp. libani]GGV96177.1 hypothetical protein GCM10010500_38280 [Streptomyces libani subsp. libani]
MGKAPSGDARDVRVGAGRILGARVRPGGRGNWGPLGPKYLLGCQAMPQVNECPVRARART